MKTLLTLTLIASTLASLPAQAGPYTDALSNCLTDNTTGKERKDLARWIFFAIAAHPELRDLARPESAAKDRTNQLMGQLVTRLIADNCGPETRAAVSKEGSEALKNGFGTLGKLAMQELMSNSSVTTAVGEFEKYMDMKKLNAALAPQ